MEMLCWSQKTAGGASSRAGSKKIKLGYGCEYFDCAINDEVFEKCAVLDKQGRLNGVETYRNYYGTKKTDKWTLMWNKGKDDEPEWYIPTF
jgi:hypothetical protein